MRIAMLGDTHGNVRDIIDAMKMLDGTCDIIFQLGDFGYFPRWEKHKDFPKLVSDITSVPFYFLAGNHEDWESLPKERNKFHQIEKNVFYSPTGNTFTFGSKTFLTVGGGYSIDKVYRTPGLNWFKEEMLTYEDCVYCTNLPKVDVILSHDCPLNVDLDVLPIAESFENRRMLQGIFDYHLPKFCYHGHYHCSYKRIVDGCEFNGVSCNGSGPFQISYFDV